MKRSIAVAIAVMAMLATRTAAAQGVDEFGAYGGLEKENNESPQNFAFEIRFGDYAPNVDDEFGGAATPFRDTFGNGFQFYFGLEVDWQAIRIPKFGSFGPAFGFGTTKAGARSLVPDQPSGIPREDLERTDQGTSLRIFPMYLAGVLRVDVLATEFGVPLVPYGKLGLGYAFWWVKSGGSGARVGSARGRGASYGPQWALGGMLLLDSIDPDAAIEMDANTGVNNSYLFIEWYNSYLDGFGGDRMDVGTNTWMLGLALEI